jgi:hypothetical protein
LQKRWQQCIDCGGDYFEGDRNHYLISWILYFLQTQSRNFVDKSCIMVVLRASSAGLWASFILFPNR